MFDYLLFDLDGTLTDSKEGITKSVQYALRCFDIDEPDLDKLEPFIGPPLKNSFMEFYGFDEAKAQEAVGKYREYFNEKGIFQNAVYPGVPQMLKSLKEKGKKLAVSSSKPQVYVEQILEHFHIRSYFDVVVGSELNGARSEKSEVVEEALRQLLGGKKPGHEAAAIIGDRKFDVEGGQAHDITTIAVSYGFGSMEELKEAKAEYIVRSVGELKNLLLRGTEDAKYEPPFHKISKLVFPMLMAYLVWQIGGYMGAFLTVFLAQSIP
ncbi:MAG: HAD hydrolase-like protein, partial [Lachnospiraceae bacterium]|nr:HAD hydrolase-like protein [Lachnospiraceae bacterium]